MQVIPEQSRTVRGVDDKVRLPGGLSLILDAEH